MPGWYLRGKREHEADSEHQDPMFIPIYASVKPEQVHWL